MIAASLVAVAAAVLWLNVVDLTAAPVGSRYRHQDSQEALSGQGFAMKPIRIVCVSDLHGVHLDAGLLKVPAGDVLVVAGDIELTCDQDAQALRQWLAGMPHTHKVVTFGNMDSWAVSRSEATLSAALGGVTVLKDSSADILGYRFVGSPQTPKFYGSFQLSTQASARQHWSKVLPPDAQVDVLVTHGPPHGYGDVTQGRHVGDQALLDAVQQLQQPPLLWVCGHIHSSYGMHEVPHPGGVIPLANSAMADVRKQAHKIRPHVVDVQPRT